MTAVPSLFSAPADALVSGVDTGDVGETGPVRRELEGREEEVAEAVWLLTANRPNRVGGVGWVHPEGELGLRRLAWTGAAVAAGLLSTALLVGIAAEVGTGMAVAAMVLATSGRAGTYLARLVGLYRVPLLAAHAWTSGEAAIRQLEDTVTDPGQLRAWHRKRRHLWSSVRACGTLACSATGRDLALQVELGLVDEAARLQVQARHQASR